MPAIEALGELGSKVVWQDDHLVRKHYYPGHHPEQGTPVNGWTGPETVINELIPTNSTLTEKGDLISKCAWCDPTELPVPENKRGFTDGICNPHKQILLREIVKK